MGAALTEIIDARCVETTIRSAANQVLAIDVAGDFAAVFRLDFGPDGEARAEATIARRNSLGQWAEMVSGGSSLRLPQSFTRDCLGEHLNVLCITGANTFLHDDTEIEVLAVVGIASNVTDRLLVRTTDRERQLSVGQSGAFAILASRAASPLTEDTPMVLVTPSRHGVALSEPKPLR